MHWQGAEGVITADPSLKVGAHKNDLYISMGPDKILPHKKATLSFLRQVIFFGYVFTQCFLQWGGYSLLRASTFYHSTSYKGEGKVTHQKK